MGLIARLSQPETRAAQQILPASLMTPPTMSGVTVTHDSSIGYSAVFAAINTISGAIGTLPLKVYRREGRARIEAVDHPLYRVLHDQPTRRHSSIEWRAVLQGHVLSRGNAYCEIIRNPVGEVVELLPLNPDAVDIEVGRRDRRVYVVNFERRQPARLAEANVFHLAGLGFDGIKGWSVITLARQSIGLGLAMEQYAAAFFGNGSRPSGILTTEAQFENDEVVSRIKESWESAHRGLSRAHRVAVLEGGLQWQQIGLTAEDSQFLQSREFGVREVSRWFNIPPHKLRDMEDATFSNIEQQNIEFYTDTIQPWVTRWEQAASVQLLTERDRQRGFYVEFNIEGLLRGDSEKRSAFYQALFNMGAITANEIREKENMDPVEGGDTPFIRLDMIPLNRADEWADAQVEGDEPDGPKLLEAASTDRPRPVEQRATDRLDVRGEFDQLLKTAGRQMVRREVRRIQKLRDDLLADDPEAFRSAVETFYREQWPAEVVAIMGPALRAYINAVARTTATDIGADAPDVGTFQDEYVASFSDRYSARSRRSVQRAAAEDPAALDELLQKWDEGTHETPGRGDMTARREAQQALNATAKAVFVAAGVLSFRWRTRNDNCPMCSQLEGAVVLLDNPFVAAGSTVVGSDGTRITPRRSVGHPPLHDGCDCYIAPGS